MSIMNVTCAG